MKIEAAQPGDHPEILALNESGLPHVNRISGAELARFAAESFYLRVARNGARVAGFLLAFCEAADYHSPNFLWFKSRYPRFVYVDRIVVAPGARRSGIGQRFYADLEAAAAAHASALCCEVNLEPPNPGSLAFHERLGFAEVGRQHTDGGAKHVCLMAKDIASPRR